MKSKVKPTRQDLVSGIHLLEELIGLAHMHYANDQDVNGFEKGSVALEEALQFCQLIRSYEDPFVQETKAVKTCRERMKSLK